MDRDTPQMAKILTFRNKGDAPTGQDFLTDETQTLSFRMTEDGEFSLGALTRSGLGSLFPDPKKDWSNQELADLFRVRQLLGAANVPVETDRGVTDEGDPWFVFCHANGEVFIHLCRIDGLYVLDSPNVLRPLRGADFNALIADFTNQALPARSSEEDPERRVIRLERGGKVRLHPSAMLAALIWTLFLASEELVLLAPEEQNEDSDALLNFDGMFAVDTASETAVDLFFETDHADWGQMLRNASIDTEHPILQDGPAQMRDAQHQQQGLATHANAFGMGLSTIAIAMGFMSETVLLNNQRKVLEGLKELGFSEYGSETEDKAASTILADSVDDTMLTMLAEFLGLENTVSQADRHAAHAGDSDTLDEANLSHLTADVIDEAGIFKSKLPTPAITRDKLAASEKEAQTLTAETKDDTELSLATTNGEDTLASEADSLHTILSKFALTWQPLMEEFKLGQTTIKASFDIHEFDAFSLFELIDTSAAERTTSIREFDTLALRLIEFLEAKDGDIGFIELDNEVIMIDRTAVTGGQTEYVQWEAADGRTISFIGLAADFEQFDMIA